MKNKITQITTNYTLNERKKELLKKANIMQNEGIISHEDYLRYTKVFNRLISKNLKLILRIELIEFNRRFENALNLLEIILWDVVKHGTEDIDNTDELSLAYANEDYQEYLKY